MRCDGNGVADGRVVQRRGPGRVAPSPSPVTASTDGLGARRHSAAYQDPFQQGRPKTTVTPPAFGRVDETAIRHESNLEGASLPLHPARVHGVGEAVVLDPVFTASGIE